MTTQNPDMAYGEQSIQGVGRLLLGGAPAALLPLGTAGAEPLRPLADIADEE